MEAARSAGWSSVRRSCLNHRIAVPVAFTKQWRRVGEKEGAFGKEESEGKWEENDGKWEEM